MIGYSKIALPLNKLLTKNTPFKWTPDYKSSLIYYKSHVKQALTIFTNFEYPNVQSQLILSFDASGKEICYVFSQIQDDNKEHRI